MAILRQVLLGLALLVLTPLAACALACLWVAMSLQVVFGEMHPYVRKSGVGFERRD